eukprot:589068-Prymnesium_polylepis.1
MLEASRWLDDDGSSAVVFDQPPRLERIDLVIWADDVWACWSACAPKWLGEPLVRSVAEAERGAGSRSAGREHDAQVQDEEHPTAGPKVRFMEFAPEPSR